MIPVRLRRWLGEPLLHFLLIGCLLFALDAWWSSRSAAGTGGTLVVGENRIRALAENFRRTWQRPPTRDELDHVVDEFVRDEILTREAERLGLANDDTVIKRRLRQKLEIITEESSASEEVTDAQLQAFLDAHADAFRADAHIAFDQVFFDPSKRGDHVEADIAAALARLNDGRSDGRRPASADFAGLGDALFVLQPSVPLSTQSAIAASFGRPFADALAALPADALQRWVGPVESGYGQHLVRLRERQPGAAPSLAEIRPVVEREYRNMRRNEVRDAHYQALRAQYEVLVKWPQGAQ